MEEFNYAEAEQNTEGDQSLGLDERGRCRIIMP